MCKITSLNLLFLIFSISFWELSNVEANQGIRDRLVEAELLMAVVSQLESENYDGLIASISIDQSEKIPTVLASIKNISDTVITVNDVKLTSPHEMLEMWSTEGYMIVKPLPSFSEEGHFISIQPGQVILKRYSLRGYYFVPNVSYRFTLGLIESNTLVVSFSELSGEKGADEGVEP